MSDIPSYKTRQDQEQGLSDIQDKVLALLPIPSAILSIFGSSIIIYVALKTREQKKWTPYTRLLMGLSVCDIIASISQDFCAQVIVQECGHSATMLLAVRLEP
jgi:hypothetical protein